MPKQPEPDVRPGQIWADHDPRSAGRTVRVEKVYTNLATGVRYAVVKTLTPARNVGKVGQTTRVQVKRFKPTQTGYLLISDAPDPVQEA